MNTYAVHSRHVSKWLYGGYQWSPCPCDWCHPEDLWTPWGKK